METITLFQNDIKATYIEFVGKHY